MTYPDLSETAPHYCLNCLSNVEERDAECSGCHRSFAGSGRFQRIMGDPPRPLRHLTTSRVTPA